MTLFHWASSVAEQRRSSVSPGFTFVLAPLSQVRRQCENCCASSPAASESTPLPRAAACTGPLIVT